MPLIEDGQAIHGKIQSQHLPFFPVGKRVTDECGRLLRAWARGENTNRPAEVQRRDEGTGGVTPSAPPVSLNSELLVQYHNTLSGEIDAESLKSAHATFKSRFGGEADATTYAAKTILSAHSARVKGEVDAEATNTYVQSVIAGEHL